MTTEREYQQAVIDLARLHGWRVAHFRAALTGKGWRTPVAADGAGFPDLCLVRDRIVFIELKAGNGPVRADQTAWLRALRGAGVEAHLVRLPGDWPLLEATLRPPGHDFRRRQPGTDPPRAYGSKETR